MGFDHGVGHPSLLLCHAKAPNYRKSKALNDVGHYSGWPKVADAVIKAPEWICWTTGRAIVQYGREGISYANIDSEEGVVHDRACSQRRQQGRGQGYPRKC